MDKDDRISEKDQICKCGHSLERHVRMHNSLVCIERFCHCSSFKLNTIK